MPYLPQVSHGIWIPCISSLLEVSEGSLKTHDFSHYHTTFPSNIIKITMDPTFKTIQQEDLLHGPCQLHVLPGNVTGQDQPTKKIALHNWFHMHVTQLPHILLIKSIVINNFTHHNYQLSELACSRLSVRVLSEARPSKWNKQRKMTPPPLIILLFAEPFFACHTDQEPGQVNLADVNGAWVWQNRWLMSVIHT